MSSQLPEPEYKSMPCFSSMCNGKTRQFMRVVLVSEEWTHFSNRGIIGGPPPPPSLPHAEFQESPFACCDACHAVQYIGPGPEAVSRSIQEKREEIQSKPRQL